MRSTYTIAELEISPDAYDEIRGRLAAAGYSHTFMEGGAIDMHGIGLMRGPGPTARPIDEYHEDEGNVVWWAWIDGAWAGEPAWIGQPDDSDWPGYHTHWTTHPSIPEAPHA